MESRDASVAASSSAIAAGIAIAATKKVAFRVPLFRRLNTRFGWRAERS